MAPKLQNISAHSSLSSLPTVTLQDPLPLSVQSNTTHLNFLSGFNLCWCKSGQLHHNILIYPGLNMASPIATLPLLRIITLSPFPPIYSFTALSSPSAHPVNLSSILSHLHTIPPKE